jgi:hypothetical protein
VVVRSTTGIKRKSPETRAGFGACSLWRLAQLVLPGPSILGIAAPPGVPAPRGVGRPLALCGGGGGLGELGGGEGHGFAFRFRGPTAHAGGRTQEDTMVPSWSLTRPAGKCWPRRG